MRIIVCTCEACGSAVAGNVLAGSRTVQCPGFDCDETLRFEDLPRRDREHILANADRYGVGGR